MFKKVLKLTILILVSSNLINYSFQFYGNNSILAQTNQSPRAFDQTTNEFNLHSYKYIVWSAGDEEDRFILFARSIDGGKSYSPAVSLSGNIHAAVFDPEVSSSGKNVYVVWQGESDNGNQDIFLRRSSNYGATFGEVENISNDPGGSANPELIVLNNRSHLTWEGTTPGNNFIFYTKSDDGSNFDPPQIISNDRGISYKPEFIVNDNLVSDSFTYKVTDNKGSESNVATVDVNIDEVNRLTKKEAAESVSIDSNHEINITLKGNDQDNDPLKFKIVAPPSAGRLYNFDPDSGTVTYIPNENNEVDISWHNYLNGHDQILTKAVNDGKHNLQDRLPIGINDPFKSKR